MFTCAEVTFPSVLYILMYFIPLRVSKDIISLSVILLSKTYFATQRAALPHIFARDPSEL